MTILRSRVTWIAALAAVILIWLQLPEDWPISQPTGTLNTVLTWAFWLLSLLIVALLFTDSRAPEASVVEVEGPNFSRYLFANTRAGLFWLPIRIFLGLSWFEAGVHKVTGGGWLDVDRRSPATGSTPSRSQSRERRRSPTTGIGSSSPFSSMATTKPGSRGSSRSASSRSASASSWVR